MQFTKTTVKSAMVSLLSVLGTKAFAQIQYQNFNNHPRAYTQRKSFWFEGNINGTLKKDDSGKTRLQYQIDWQYRRAADASYIKGGDHMNIMKDMFQHVFRPWLHYWAVPGKVRFSVSPLGQWGTWTPAAEGTLKYYVEYRSSWQLSLFQKIGKLDLQQRYRYEFRWVGNQIVSKSPASDLFANDFIPTGGYKNRLRYMLRANYPISKDGKKYLSLWDEVFMGFGRNVGNTKIFDQNRIVALYGRKLNTERYPMKLEVGLTWQLAPKYSFNVPPTQDPSYGSYQLNNWESNLCFQVYLIFDEFHKFRNRPKR